MPEIVLHTEIQLGLRWRSCIWDCSKLSVQRFTWHTVGLWLQSRNGSWYKKLSWEQEHDDMTRARWSQHHCIRPTAQESPSTPTEKDKCLCLVYCLLLNKYITNKATDKEGSSPGELSFETRFISGLTAELPNRLLTLWIISLVIEIRPNSWSSHRSMSHSSPAEL